VNDFDRFKDNKESILFFNRPFDLDLDNDTHLVLYSVPFSYHELYSFVLKINKSPKYLHMIFNQDDIDLNHKLINKNLPEKVFLIKLFKTIKTYNNDEDINKDLKKYLSEELNSSISKIEKALSIFKELNLIKIDKNKVNIDSNKDLKLDLSKSVYYNNIIEVKNKYTNLERDLQDKNLFKLIKRLNNFKGENNEF
ncbi:MAG: single-stranded-DNA-specific exonuclease C-terminal domain-containing protein, partial [Halanaerobiales bacterium]|nr:single-stranded-DNA-specific exonuclease C-terminal domain-containing protein [Halanaerobiales bacterium]